MKKDEFTIEIDQRDQVEMNRKARRKARMEKFGQEKFGTKIEKPKVRYNRNQKHRRKWDEIIDEDCD